MAIYKPTDCVPSGDCYDVSNSPIFFECKIDTNNAVVSGYSIEVYKDEERVFPEQDRTTLESISLVSELKTFFDNNFSEYGNGYINLNTGLNGSYLKIPFICDNIPENTLARNMISPSDINNGYEYTWKITLYQEVESGGSVSLPGDPKYYDMIISNGKVLGSNNERIQTALVQDDEDIVNGLVLIDKYIQPVNIKDLDFDPNDPKRWYGEKPTMDNMPSRVMIENYDSIYGHIYPTKSTGASFSPEDITEANGVNAFQIYKNGNDPENLGATDKVYEVINDPLDIQFVISVLNHEQGEPTNSFYVEVNGQCSSLLDGKIFVTNENDSTIVQYNQISISRFENLSNTFRLYFSISGTNPININNPSSANYYLFCKLHFSGIFSGIQSVNIDYDVGSWEWIETPANLSQSHWKQTYVTTTNPTNNGYRPFWYVNSVSDLYIYGNERIIFNHMINGSAYMPPASVGEQREYLGSCYNGIFYPSPSSEPDDIDNPTYWTVTINWYRTTDADTWGELLNKVVYVEVGSTDTPNYEITSDDVIVGAGANAEITIGSTSGVLNSTPFMFVSEKPIKLFNVSEKETETVVSVSNIGTNTNIYLIELSRPISSVLSIETSSSVLSSTEYSYCVNSKNIYYTPSSGNTNISNVTVTYEVYSENDYTGVIFYNSQILKPKKYNGYLYIKPFIGISKDMIYRDSSGSWFPIYDVNTKYWYIEYDASAYNMHPLQWEPETNDRYQIRSFYKEGDIIPFSLYNSPNISVNIYNMYGNQADVPQSIFDPYEINTRGLIVKASYEQSNYILWESYEFSLYSVNDDAPLFSDKELIDSSVEKYDGEISYNFFGGEVGSYYRLYLTLITNSGLKVINNYLIHFEYVEGPSNPDVECVFNENDLCVDINIYEPIYEEEYKSKDVFVYRREIWYDPNVRNEGSSYGKSYSTKWSIVGSNVSTNGTLKDYMVASGHRYEYMVCCIGINSSDEPVECWVQYCSVKVNYMGWCIVELHPDGEKDETKKYKSSAVDVWRFKYNVSSGSQTQNISKNVQDTLSMLPRISVGEKNSIDGQVSCLLGRDVLPANYTNKNYDYVNGAWRETYGPLHNDGGYKEQIARYNNICGSNSEYQNAEMIGNRNNSSNAEVDMINAWNDVAYSGNPKLLKDEKGRMYIVQITSSSMEVQESYIGMPTNISFGWVEIKKCENITVYGVDVISEIEINGDIDNNAYEGYSDLKTIRIDLDGVSTVEDEWATFGHNCFHGCENVDKVIVYYANNTPGIEIWTKHIAFLDENSNPLSVSANAMLMVQNTENGPLEFVSSFGEYNGQHMNYIPNDYAFYKYNGLAFVGIETIDDEDPLTISPYVFYGCKNLKKLQLTEYVYIEDGAFVGCDSLESVQANINVINGLPGNSIIDASVILGGVSTELTQNRWKKLKEISFEEGAVTSIADGVFAGTKLESIDLSNMHQIGAGVFAGCTALKSIHLPFIGYDGSGSYPQYTFGYLFGKNAFPEGEPVVQRYYKTTDTELGEQYYIPKTLESVTVVASNYMPKYAFMNCRMLKSVEVGSLSDNIFEGCSNLEFVKTLNEITEINDNAFYACLKLSGLNVVGAIQIPGTVTRIGDSSFYWCSSIGEIEIPSATTSIGRRAFFNSSITRLSGMSSVWDIGDLAFGNCKELVSIDIGHSAPYISAGNCIIEVDDGTSSVIVGCTNSEIPSDITSIKYGAFYGSAIRSIDIPESVMEIEPNAFYECEIYDAVFEANNSSWLLTKAGYPDVTVNVSEESYGTMAYYLVRTYVDYTWTKNS